MTEIKTIQKRTSASIVRNILYWIPTGLIALETAAGAQWDLVRNPFVSKIMEQLGYPPYLLTIMGLWKILAVLALLAPGFPRVKEWAYAGVFFIYAGAACSHLAVNDSPGAWGPFIFIGLTLASWALRPAGRRLTGQQLYARYGTGTVQRKDKITYWIATGIIGFVLLSGGIADVMRVPATADGMTSLGYPLYFVTLLGICKLLATITLFAPRFAVLKEWAYAGILFDFSGAVMSHAFMGQGGHIPMPVIFAGLTLVSWNLHLKVRAVAH